MTFKSVLRGLLMSGTIIAMIPAGWIIGIFCGEHLARFVLYLEGKDSSHGDLSTFVGTGAGLGAVTATVFLPFVAWFLIKRLRK